MKILEWILTGEGGAALITGLLSVVTTSFLFFARKLARTSKKFEKRVEVVRQSNVILDDLRINNSSYSARVMLMKTENGGGIPRPTAHVTSSVLEESFSDDLNPLKPIWQDQMTDTPHDDLIIKTIKEDVVRIATADLSGMLKNLFLAHEIRGAIFVRIREQYPFVYCVLTLKKGVNLDQAFNDPILLDQIRTAQTSLQKLYKAKKIESLLFTIGKKMPI